ncbi:hypothetical protein AVEN_100220-1, partial [Araneus ventricosus]
MAIQTGKSLTSCPQLVSTPLTGLDPDSNFSLQQACHKFVMTRVQVCDKFVVTRVQAC